jgi:uncharacterized protein
MSNDAALDQAAGGAADRPGWHPAVAWLTDRLAAIPSVERVVLFGSRARGDHGPRPDIDLAVEAPEASTEDRARMVELVEDAPTLLAIDLVRLDTAEPALRAAVAREGSVLHERDQAGQGERVHAGVRTSLAAPRKVRNLPARRRSRDHA